MQFDSSAVVVHVEVQEARKDTNPVTGEVTEIRESGFLYLLVTENGEPVIKRAKCTILAAKQFQLDAKAFLKGCKTETLPLDNREYKLDNGRQGFTLTLVEEGKQRRQRASFSLDDDPFEEVKTASEDLKPAPRPVPNGTPALVGAR